MRNSDHHVAVLGASPKPARYSNQCIRLLRKHGYGITPVHPRFAEIEGLPVSASLEAITDPVHTLTLYVGPKLLEPQVDAIIGLRPGRVIFNPGTESELVQQRLSDAGIEWFEACTLVMLKTDQF
ncbi:MAG: CoA-binding protein [Gammaproteobacteria bacterium]|nr:CoA-binding protein [Gammaproteobacteria bacterium]MCB1923025.1 CoA-binding protein [Gammaproteobacteria bacterium]